MAGQEVLPPLLELADKTIASLREQLGQGAWMSLRHVDASSPHPRTALHIPVLQGTIPP